MTDTKEGRVLSLKDRAKKQAGKTQSELSEEPFSFAEILRRNQENIERMKKERGSANQSLVRQLGVDKKD